VTDLRDQLADFEAAARDDLADLIAPYTTPQRARHIADAILDAGWLPPRTGGRSKATCHPDRPVDARGLCTSCYELHWRKGTLGQFPTRRTMRSREDFIADYKLLRSEGYNRRQIAERLRMPYSAVNMAYRRAVAAGALTPDRRSSA
jgi:hypothetical protein